MVPLTEIKLAIEHDDDPHTMDFHKLRPSSLTLKFIFVLKRLQNTQVTQV